MSIAAIPQYLGTNFHTASPGLRFGMYLPLWGIDHGEDGTQHRLLWETHDINYRPSGPRHELRAFKDENKTACLRAACPLTEADKATLKALSARQAALSKATPNLLILDAQAVAPFSTGLGNEHPLENGFAFLNPYGLPYLPGSGVKGVLRQAARELAEGQWGDKAGWSNDKYYALEINKKKVMLSMLDVLFGLESENHEKEHVRGALTFWDVIPQIKGNALAVDIMTPHQSHYYQNGESPHESGSPNPISFLTVPPKSRFIFHVQCDIANLQRLAPELVKDESWRELLESAFEHAFDWLGFGAKTSVGYGAMRENPEIAQQRAAENEKLRLQQEADAVQRAHEALPSDQRLLAEMDTELQKLPRDPRDNSILQQQTTTQHWQNILGKLQEQSSRLDDLAPPVRETLVTEVKKRLLAHFNVTGKAEKSMKQALATLRGMQ
ncbi:hypothetical protein AGMMS49545_00090 [Betaproteobacteria bacterium]|nr:hypothetical protein AGMMS49545_00090 [Betaproteobacteria bacterium]